MCHLQWETKLKETTLGQVNCALYTPSFCPQCSQHQAVESQSPVASEFLLFPKVPLGPKGLGIYFLSARVDLVLRIRQREFGDLGLYATDCGWRMCSYLFCVLSL